MGNEPMGFQGESMQFSGVERELVSGEEIQRRVQAMIDADPALGKCDKKIHAPMPKPTAGESMTGCNWTMHYRGQFPDCEERIDDIVEIVQHDVNIGRSVLNG
ncbi:MAG: hypothetical protein EOP61_39925 [Sphingomonadales bacterium]|nr:MAG: hypothetical protein EOP61_39925 [Sphingomonadales bacterium]